MSQLDRDVCANRYYHALRTLNDLEPALREHMVWLEVEPETRRRVDQTLNDIRYYLGLHVNSAKESTRMLMELMAGELNVPLI